jgi:hypothetical protein
VTLRSRPDVEFFYCPYCGGQALWPVPDPADVEWECRECLRTFIVTFLAIGHAPRSLS